MSIAFIFAGQGSQNVGMGNDFYLNNEYAKKIYDMFPGIRDLSFDGPKEVLDQTAYCQQAMLLTSYVYAKALELEGIKPEYTCGLSLGEYSALAFNDVWEIKDAIDIISFRGRIMQDALPLNTSKMAAVIGLDRNTILDTISNIDGVCEIANYNCPGQIVITGDVNAIATAQEKLTLAGAKIVLPLNVSGAFHSSLLKEASNKLRTKLDEHSYKNPKYKMVYNLTGEESTKNLYDLLQQQICNSVYFEDSIRYLIDKGVDTFIEIGPGKTLSGFVKKIDNNVRVLNVSSFEGFKEVVGGLK